MSIEPEKLMAFVDGELDEAERGRVEAAIAADPNLRAEVDRQRRLRTALVDHYGPVAQEAVPDGLRAMLGAEANESMAGVASLSDARSRRRILPAWRNAAAIAASLAIGLIAGQLIPRGVDTMRVENGRMLARGQLAKALETQLASTQAMYAPTRIGITFADANGRPCRTFDTDTLSGLACRSEGQWQMIMTTTRATAAQGHYRQAASSPIMETAQQMMTSAPLDADEERAAMTAGWRIAEK